MDIPAKKKAVLDSAVARWARWRKLRPHGYSAATEEDVGRYDVIFTEVLAGLPPSVGADERSKMIRESAAFMSRTDINVNDMIQDSYDRLSRVRAMWGLETIVVPRADILPTVAEEVKQVADKGPDILPDLKPGDYMPYVAGIVLALGGLYILTR